MMRTPRQDEVLDRLTRMESKIDYILDPKKHDYSSYDEEYKSIEHNTNLGPGH